MQPAGETAPTDIRDQLRRDHQTALAELEALRRFESARAKLTLLEEAKAA